MLAYIQEHIEFFRILTIYKKINWYYPYNKTYEMVFITISGRRVALIKV